MEHCLTLTYKLRQTSTSSHVDVETADGDHVADTEVRLLLAQSVDAREHGGGERVAVVLEDVVVRAGPVRPALVVAHVVVRRGAVEARAVEEDRLRIQGRVGDDGLALVK